MTQKNEIYMVLERFMMWHSVHKFIHLILAQNSQLHTHKAWSTIRKKHVLKLTMLRYEMLELQETGRGCGNAGCGSCGKESECFTT